jgi:hypothetical protein
VQRGQATVEYLGVVLLALVCACALVRFHTPVQRLAGDIARIVEHRGRTPAPPRRAHGAVARHARRPPDGACLCPFSAQ